MEPFFLKSPENQLKIGEISTLFFLSVFLAGLFIKVEVCSISCSSRCVAVYASFLKRGQDSGLSQNVRVGR